MSYKDKIKKCSSHEEIDALFADTLKSAGEKHSDQVIAVNSFCSELKELIKDGTITFLSGGIDFIPYAGGLVINFRPFTKIKIK